ncbi:MAG: carbamoyl-phosphate synthase large subunit [Halobacteriota archaeon]|nr:carbamoyl-phosphate synthase large subunit [Halobacteriota archaeon]
MPKRDDIRKILLVGSGPIIIGQACEFDYSGTQACKALIEEGYEVVLVNSNPATIMTDPDFSHRTFIEPITPEIVAKIIEQERPDAFLPTIGGQTGLNIAVSLVEDGVIEKYKVELIGANFDAIKKAEDRLLFKEAMKKIGLEVPKSAYVSTMQEGKDAIEDIGFPVIIRPSFTLGGTGGSIAYNKEEFDSLLKWGLDASPASKVLLEESVLGWKEYELEVMRDKADNVVIICSIENFDPMGVHTGDSITVAPSQTLTDKEYQLMRDASLDIIREIGVDTGGSNIQFGINPEDGRMVVIEMNPRVSRSSALASKATGFPIAKIAAKLACGYTLDEIPNDITKETYAAFEPTIDYVVTKVPRFTFEKFIRADDLLSTQMKSVGEAMAIGRTFKESLQKALSSLEVDSYGLESSFKNFDSKTCDKILEGLVRPNSRRIWQLADALRAQISPEEIYNKTGIDPWFIDQIQQIVEEEKEIQKDKELLQSEIKEGNSKSAAFERIKRAKEMGFSDKRLALLLGTTEKEIRSFRKTAGLSTVFKRVDTCAAEFEAYTPYLYSTYESECEASPTEKRKILILGGGPNRIGQGIEFDYCCVHASFALKEDGFETIMVNCNPETVSTDYDTSDRLYFEPLTYEHVLNIVEKEKPDGVIVQFGGQSPLKLAVSLQEAGVPIVGTSPDAIDRAEDRKRFKDLLHKLGLRQPENDTVSTPAEALEVAKRIGYPVVVRPSYVLGGRAMEIVYDDESLTEYLESAVQVSPDHPILIDRFLSSAIEIDVDAVCDGEEVAIAGIMEHIEEAGVHSGDSACSLPPYSLPEEIIDEVCRQTEILALELGVIGLINIQFACQEKDIYLLEVNPRASRTVPFISKATGIPWAKVAARIIGGKKLKELNVPKVYSPVHVSVKEAVFPFVKFQGVDTILGPEMRSTGEVMGIDQDFGRSFYKAQLAAGNPIPPSGNIIFSINEADKPDSLPIARDLSRMGYRLLATSGTFAYLKNNGVECDLVNKVNDTRPNVVDLIKNGEVDIVINTTAGKESILNSQPIRRTALEHNVPYFTTMAAGRALVKGMESQRKSEPSVKALQDYYN